MVARLLTIVFRGENHVIKYVLGAALAAALPTVPAAAVTLVGSYGFNNTLTSSTPGQTLGLIDPTGRSGFGTDTVFGQQRTVFNFRGTNATGQQSGLTFDTGGLLTANSYSVALTFKFNERDGQWRRIMDVSNRTSDNGLYADPSNNLNVFPSSGSAVNFTSGKYRNVVLTVNGGQTSLFVDGGANFTANNNVMHLTNGPGRLTFFADNALGGGQGEWSSGSIAALRVYNGVLGAAEIAELNKVPFVAGAVPEPATWGMMILGFGLVGGAMRRSHRPVTAIA
jgi:hypothetical protein